MASQHTAMRKRKRSREASETAQRLWFKIHLYVGLLLGLPFALLGLTGSLLVFDHAIDEHLNPALLLTDRASNYRTLNEMVSAAELAAPENAKPIRLFMPRLEQSVVLIDFDQNEAKARRRIEIAVDPYTAQVLGRREYGHYLTSFIYKLHYTLWLGAAGEVTVGIVGLFLFTTVLTGLYLWWPKGGQIRKAFTIKRGASIIRFCYDLHKLSGFCVTLVLTVVAFTGVYMVFPQYVKPLVNIVSPLTDLPENLIVTAQRPAEPITIDRAVKSARRVFPDAELQRIYFPLNQEGLFRVYLRQADEVRKTSGSSRVWVDQYTGEIVASHGPKSLSVGDRFLIWMFPLHNGEAFGLVGRVVVFVCGLFPLLLYATGILVWWRKRRKRLVRT